MTAEEKEIRDAERKAIAEVRRWRLKSQKRTEGMTYEEKIAYFDKSYEDMLKWHREWREKQQPAAAT